MYNTDALRLCILYNAILAALAAFGVDESNSFIRLGPAIARWLSAMGLSALAGCGLAWLIHHIHRKRN